MAQTLSATSASPYPTPTPVAAPHVVAWRPVAAIAAAKLAFGFATSSLYGLHRDEFYYLASGRHLAWGYVDQPPLVPALYRLSADLFGSSVAGLHVVPVLIGGVYIALAALLTAELGGGRRAQTLAALVGALGPLYLTTSHFLSTVSLDIVAWAFASLLVLRVIRTGNTRLWVAVGAVVGLGLLNKHTMAIWVLGTGAGLLATPQRRLLANRWAIAGAALAAAIFAPNIVWQAQHHWATVEFVRNLQANNAAASLTQFVPLQLAMVTLAGTIVWIAGLRTLAVDPAWRRFRWLAVAYALCFVGLLIAAGKAYYLGSWYLPLIAVGATSIERRWTASGARRLTAAVLATGLLTAPVFTPILPERLLVAAGLDKANSDMGAMLGWSHVVDQIARIVRTLPAADRRQKVILTEDYSEAGALNLLGPRLGLPTAISGHNTYWWWGHPNTTKTPTVIAVGIPQSLLARYWGHIQQVGTLGDDRTPIDPQERGTTISVCTDQLAPWSTIWPAMRHYG